MKITNEKILDLYQRARDEYSHPDPERAIFGRGNLAAFDTEFNNSGRMGVFGVSEKKARALGYEDLDNVEENFNAAMELDLTNYRDGDIDLMFAATAGITGGQDNRNRYMNSLDSSSEEIYNSLEFEDGVAIGFINGSSVEASDSSIELDNTTEEGLKSDTKRVSAEMQRNVLVDEFGVVTSTQDVSEAMSLLKAYINEAV